MVTVVVNAAGAQGRAITQQLRQHGEVRPLSRSGADGTVAVDTGSKAALAEAFAGAEAVVFTPPLDLRPGVRQALAERVTAAAEAVGVRRLVLNTAAAVPEEPLAGTEALREIRDIVRSARLGWTVVQPTIYLDNLVAPWSLPHVVEEGVLAYPVPETAQVSWISHRALGDFIRAVLATQETLGRTYDIGGPEPLTGSALAATVSRAAGREVRYVAADVNAFVEQLAQLMGPGAITEIGGIYRRLAEDLTELSRSSEPWAEVGARPEAAEQWAARQSWRLG